MNKQDLVAELLVTTTILLHNETNLNMMPLSSYLIDLTVNIYYHELHLYSTTDAKFLILMKKWFREVLMMESANTPWQCKYGYH